MEALIEDTGYGGVHLNAQARLHIYFPPSLLLQIQMEFNKNYHQEL